MPDAWPAFPSHREMGQYLQDFATQLGLLGSVRLRHRVVSAEASPAGGWRVFARGPAGCVAVDASALVVANGHNNRPHLPPLLEGFAGDQSHSSAYTAPDALSERRVLVVGAGASAMDIAVDASFHARAASIAVRRGVWVLPKHVLGKPVDAAGGGLLDRLPWRARQAISERLLRVVIPQPASFGLPAPERGLLQESPAISDLLLSRIAHGRLDVRPAPAGADGSTVLFADGSRADFDSIYWCTGYRAEMPFLSTAVVGEDPEQLALYQRIFHLDRPGLYFINHLRSSGAAAPVLEAQSALVAAHVAGAYVLPPRHEQLRQCDGHLRAARQRWGDSRPAMRVDAASYVRALDAEGRTGALRARGTGPREARRPRADPASARGIRPST